MKSLVLQGARSIGEVSLERSIVSGGANGVLILHHEPPSVNPCRQQAQNPADLTSIFPASKDRHKVWSFLNEPTLAANEALCYVVKASTSASSCGRTPHSSGL